MKLTTVQAIHDDLAASGEWRLPNGRRYVADVDVWSLGVDYDGSGTIVIGDRPRGAHRPGLGVGVDKAMLGKALQGLIVSRRPFPTVVELRVTNGLLRAVRFMTLAEAGVPGWRPRRDRRVPGKVR